MRVRLKGINSITKQLADGTWKTYYYAWKGGPALPGKPGNAEFMAAFNEAVAGKKIHHPEETVDSLITSYEDSPEFNKKLADRTKKDYKRHLRNAEKQFGDLPIECLSDRRTRQVFYDWRDKIAKRSLRQADYAWQVLQRVFSWSKKRGKIDVNPLEKPERLHSGTRIEMVWSDDQIESFMESAKFELKIAMMIALWTGLRRGDLIQLKWSNVRDGKLYVVMRKSHKTMRKVVIPIARPLLQVLQNLERTSEYILLNTKGKPWTESAFSSAWRKDARFAGIMDVVFNDLRGTAITRLALAGCTEAEIASITGHSLATVRSILDKHYLFRDPKIAENAIRKLEKYAMEIAMRPKLIGG